jgi:hypothetical protein
MIKMHSHTTLKRKEIFGVQREVNGENFDI